MFATHLIRACLIALLMMVGACQQPQPMQAAASTSPALEEEPESVTVRSLADLAQRDVEAFLARRRDGGGEGDGADAGAPVILWNARVERDLVGGPLDGAVDLAPATEVAGPGTVEVLEEPIVNEHRARSLDELIAELSRELYRGAGESDMPLRELLLIAATSLIDPDRAIAADAVPGLTQRERIVLAALQQFFTDLGRRLNDGGTDAGDVIAESIDALRAALGVEHRLSLGTLALCTRVGGFGDFEPFKSHSFLAHSEQQVVLYVEIAGFTSEQDTQGQWVTELSQELVIYSDRDGLPVWREDWQRARDATRNRRRDFFVVQLITLPKALSVGRYHLKVRVRDKKTGAEAEGAIPFEMVADPRMAVQVK